MPFTAILPAVTFAIVGTLGFQQYRRMKRKIPDEESRINPAASLQQMDADKRRARSNKANPVSTRAPRSERQGTRAAVN